jgi:hypothetical protein
MNTRASSPRKTNATANTSSDNDVDMASIDNMDDVTNVGKTEETMEDMDKEDPAMDDDVGSVTSSPPVDEINVNFSDDEEAMRDHRFSCREYKTMDEERETICKFRMMIPDRQHAERLASHVYNPAFNTVKNCYEKWETYWEARKTTKDRRMVRLFNEEIEESMRLRGSMNAIELPETGRSKVWKHWLNCTLNLFIRSCMLGHQTQHTTPKAKSSSPKARMFLRHGLHENPASKSYAMHRMCSSDFINGSGTK